MPSTTSILTNLKNKYPQFIFKSNNNFYWSYLDNTIYYDENSPHMSIFLLHELSHALLGHNQYDYDIQLITMERQSWEHTILLAPSFDINIPDDLIQNTLDSYREWIHSRSTCPKCNATGLQIASNTYKCLACNDKWRVNEAKNCALRRYEIKKCT